MGTYDFSAQYQQAPVPLGGNMIQWDWFGLVKDPPALRESSVIIQRLQGLIV